jgi:osmotically-inducible protein OsmY
MSLSFEDYGLTPHEARMVGMVDETTAGVNKDVELEGAIIRRLKIMGVEHVHVRVHFGKAYLSGMCDDFAQKRDIQMTVRSMAGEGRVVNHIKVFPAESGRS